MKKVFLVIFVCCIFACCIFICCLLAPLCVRAAGLRVWPAELNVQAEQGVLSKAEVFVENPNTNVALYEVYVDNFSDWVKIEPESFTLESRESQKIVLGIKGGEVGSFSTMLSVVAKPLSQRKFKAGPGIKIPLKIKIVEKTKNVFLAGITQNLQNFLGVGIMAYVFALILIFVLAKNWLAKHRALKKYYDSPVIKF